MPAPERAHFHQCWILRVEKATESAQPTPSCRHEIALSTGKWWVCLWVTCVVITCWIHSLTQGLAGAGSRGGTDSHCRPSDGKHPREGPNLRVVQPTPQSNWGLFLTHTGEYILHPEVGRDFLDRIQKSTSHKSQY